MKILVLSDSHSGLSFMRRAVQTLKPDAVVHLGDHYADGEVIAEENPGIRTYQVPGNCDAYRCFGKQEVLCLSVFGTKLYMTHGHRHHVKSGLYALLKDAREMGVQAALYGHTHRADCHREEDGMWVLNPGASGHYGGTVGLIEVENGEITACSILDGESF